MNIGLDRFYCDMEKIPDSAMFKVNEAATF